MELRQNNKNEWSLWDLRANKKVFDVPEHYGDWTGYVEPTGNCRLTGHLGKILPAPTVPAHNGTTTPNCM
jgi:hypothetical protein